MFKLRKDAQFSNGAKILPEDIIFSFNTIISKGHPAYKNYYNQVDFVEKISSDEVSLILKEVQPRIAIDNWLSITNFLKRLLGWQGF